MIKIGFILGSTVDPAVLPDAARVTEQSGFDSIWMSEDYFYTGGISGAATALGSTESIAVGIGLLPIYVRHPGLTAMEVSTLAGAYPGRLTVGFGSGVPAWLDQMGAPHKASLATMRETIASMRALLAGETVDGGEKFTSESIKLVYPPAQVPPLYIGATGPKMTALAGGIADGILLSILASTEFVANSRRVIDENRPAGAAHAELTAFVVFSLADTVEEARAASRPIVADYLMVSVGPLTDAAGITDELTAMIERGGRDAVFNEMPDEWIDRMTVSGDGPRCRAAIEALTAAGVDEIALLPVNLEDPISVITRAGAELGLVKA